MPNKVKVENLYRTTVTSSEAIPASGDFTFDVAVAPQNKNGFLILGSENISTRQIFYYHDVIGNTIYVRGINRITAAAIAVPSGYSVKMNDVAEIFNYFGDNISTLFYVEKMGGLVAKVWGGYLMYNNNQVLVADTTLTLTDGTTNYIKYDAPTNTIFADTIASGNIKCEVVCASGTITSILYRTSKESYLDFAISITGALPSQTGNAGKTLVTDGTHVSWGICNLSRTIGVNKGIDVDRSTGFEVFRNVTDVTTIESDDIIRLRDTDGNFNDITGANFLNSINAGVFPINSIRETFILNGFGSGYELLSSSTTGTDAFTSKTGMGTARVGHHTGVIGAKMYVAGGNNGTSGAFNTSEEYDFITNTWSSKATMPAGRTNGYSGVIAGKFYVIGGLSDWASLTSYQVNCYEYDPVANTWATRASLGAAQGEGASAVWNGRLYIIGGRNTGGTVLNTVQYYDPVANTYTTGLATIPAARWNTQHQGVSVNDTIYLVSGKDSGGTNQTTMYSYNPVANSWSTLAVVPAALHWSAVVGLTIDNVSKVLVFAGNTTGIVNTTYEYNINTNAWVTRTAGTGLIFHSAEVYNRKVYITGGYDTAARNYNTEYAPLRTRYVYERTS